MPGHTMTSTPDRRAELQRSIANCAADILAGFQRENIPTEVALAIAATVTGMLADQLPAEQRAPFLRAYANDLLRVPRYDA
jgi:hypothetical protein